MIICPSFVRECGDNKICTARFLPECAFRGREKHKLQLAVLVAARAGEG